MIEGRNITELQKVKLVAWIGLGLAAIGFIFQVISQILDNLGLDSGTDVEVLLPGLFAVPSLILMLLSLSLCLVVLPRWQGMAGLLLSAITVLLVLFRFL